MNEVDSFSKLPDHLLVFILSFLTLRDAVNLSLLSQRWRLLSSFMSRLRFDTFTILGIDCSERTKSRPVAVLQERRDKFVRRVNQFLNLYKGLKIDCFELLFDLDDESALHIDSWVSFAVKLNAEKVKVHLDPEFNTSETRKPYTFPCHLLPHGRTSQLKHLCLESCLLRPSPDSAQGLSSLKTLHLFRVPLNQDDIDNVLSSCLKIELLRLEMCSLPQTFCISSKSHCFKTLLISDCSYGQSIELNSIELRTFEYMGHVRNFTFVGVPLLVKVHFSFISPYVRGTQYMFNGLAKDVPQLQFLSLALYTPKVTQIPSRMTTFSCLKQLELFVSILSNDFDLLTITSVLNASPVLQKLHLALRFFRSFRAPPQKRENFKELHFQLKEVEISGFAFGWDEMEVALYLLKTAVALERMIINPQERYYIGGGCWHYQKDHTMVSGGELEKKRGHDLLVKEKFNPTTEIIVL